ncbi:MAG TPA: hypothetical protein VIJ38_19710 [Acidobacteriaceae bacterium]
MSDSVYGTDPISAITSTPLSIALSAAPPTARPAPPPPPPPPSDTVTLSQTAKVNQMSTAGESPEVIALSLGISLAAVTQDLRIVATQTAAPVVSPVVAIQP